MKQTFLFTLCFILFCGSLFSQNCPVGSITFTSQSQVDSFPITYPNCTTIDGNMTITSSSITNLSALSQIKTINGNLNICNNPLLISTYGLSANLGGNFWLKNNDALPWLSSSFSYNGGVYIEDNDNLGQIDYLTEVMQGLTDLRIINNPNLFFCTIVPLSQSSVSQFGSSSLSGICDYLDEGGPSEIHDNAEGCNSAEQIISYCTYAPITLTYFQAKIDNKTALLKWETATEINNAGFEIQRSTDGTNWKKIAWQDGRGTTTTAHTYTHRDENPLFGTSYYRLKQVDFDGAYEYTDIVQVNYQGRDISIYPNPVENTLHISDLNGETIKHISIYDQASREILLLHTPENIIDVSALSPGIYVLKIGVKGEIFYKKFIVDQ